MMLSVVELPHCTWFGTVMFLGRMDYMDFIAAGGEKRIGACLFEYAKELVGAGKLEREGRVRSPV